MPALRNKISFRKLYPAEIYTDLNVYFTCQPDRLWGYIERTSSCDLTQLYGFELC